MTTQDDAVSRSAASRGPVESGASTGPRQPLSYAELAARYRKTADALAFANACVDAVIVLHEKSGRVCTECGFTWPCGTILALRGEDL